MLNILCSMRGRNYDVSAKRSFWEGVVKVCEEQNALFLKQASERPSTNGESIDVDSVLQAIIDEFYKHETSKPEGVSVTVMIISHESRGAEGRQASQIAHETRINRLTKREQVLSRGRRS